MHVHKAPQASLLVKGQAAKRDILILVAPPAGGKGTQSAKISKLMNIPHLSTGDMLRGEVAKGTDIGKQAEEAMSSGSLVSDELVIKIVQSRISEEDCNNGFILDGFPRTVPQAEALDAMLGESGEEVGKIINLEVPDDVVIQRITGRWIHKPSGRSYHVLWKRPKSLGDAQEVSPELMLDDVTGEPLTQRKDDTKEAAVNRIAKYYSQTEPILTHYRSKGKGDHIETIDGDQGIDEVAADIAKVLTNPTTTEQLPSTSQNTASPGTCVAAVKGSVERESSWRRVSEKCKCPAGFKLDGEHEACKQKSRKFNADNLAGHGCYCREENCMDAWSQECDPVNLQKWHQIGKFFSCMSQCHAIPGCTFDWDEGCE